MHHPQRGASARKSGFTLSATAMTAEEGSSPTRRMRRGTHVQRAAPSLPAPDDLSSPDSSSLPSISDIEAEDNILVDKSSFVISAYHDSISTSEDPVTRLGDEAYVELPLLHTSFEGWATVQKSFSPEPLGSGTSRGSDLPKQSQGSAVRTLRSEKTSRKRRTPSSAEGISRAHVRRRCRSNSGGSRNLVGSEFVGMQRRALSDPSLARRKKATPPPSEARKNQAEPERPQSAMKHRSANKYSLSRNESLAVLTSSSEMPLADDSPHQSPFIDSRKRSKEVDVNKFGLNTPGTEEDAGDDEDGEADAFSPPTRDARHRSFRYVLPSRRSLPKNDFYERHKQEEGSPTPEVRRWDS